MDDKLNALDKLIEAVEASTADKDDHYAAFPTAMKGEHYHAWSAYHGSLDAALALHEALLPGWDYVIARANGGLTEHAQLESETYFADTTARAWLLAILRAYRSVQA